MLLVYVGYLNSFSGLNPQTNSLLFAAVLLLLQPIQIEAGDPVFQIGGLSKAITDGLVVREGVSVT